jgi:hypothetical protein
LGVELSKGPSLREKLVKKGAAHLPTVDPTRPVLKLDGRNNWVVI